MTHNTVTLQLYACAKAAKQLMGQGMHGPKVEEITKEAHGELWPIGKSDIDWVVKHLKQIKDILVKEEDMTVILVNHEYFSTFRRRQPSTPELAKKVLVHKGILKPAGLHLVTSENDTIWLASQERLGGVGIGVIGRYKREINKAVKENRLTHYNGQQIVKELKNKI